MNTNQHIMNEQENAAFEDQTIFVAHGICSGVGKFTHQNEDGTTTPMLYLRFRMLKELPSDLNPIMKIIVPATPPERAETMPGSPGHIIRQVHDLLTFLDHDLSSLALAAFRVHYLIEFDESRKPSCKAMEIFSVLEWAEMMNATRARFWEGTVPDATCAMPRWEELQTA